ncbi:hypothetical protein [Leifsonia soli]|uniref:Uncharacterized protein n=1 Tax=Leifsonia soli TaxID=582665 RepID=A0A852T089_9MICO|nr:hypothetical protein [Leifsonia soli]NYD74956.1 hypothetical protein [Leifsonia soli]
MLLLPDELSDEIRYGRDQAHLRIFVSSKMDGSLDDERKLTAKAVESLAAHQAWWWERDAPAGVLHSVRECVQIAATSDGLILLVAGPLSEIIKAEYSAAKEAEAERYIFIRTPDELPDEVETFINAERASVVTRNFQNADELEAHVYRSLTSSAIRAHREVQLERRRKRNER